MYREGTIEVLRCLKTPKSGGDKWEGVWNLEGGELGR